MNPAVGTPRLAEQRAYLTTDDGTITSIDLVCTGWQRTE